MKMKDMQSTAKAEDPLSRIQREINEVTKREHDFKNEHEALHRMSAENKPTLRPLARTSDKIPDLIERHEIPDTDNASLPNGFEADAPEVEPRPRILRAMSASQLITPSYNSGNVFRRFNTNPGQKGIMQRFIASRGRLPAPTKGSLRMDLPIAYIPEVSNTPPVIQLCELGKPLRKGYTPVEEKIQKELVDMKSRESELKKLRRQSLAMSQPDLLAFNNNENEYSEDEEEIPPPGKLRSSKSIGELCEALGSLRTPSPSLSETPDVMKPAKSLAQLCDLAPDDIPSSKKRIAEWESLIQQKQDAGLTA